MHLGVLIGVKAYEEMKGFVTQLDHSLDPSFCQRCNCTVQKADSQLQMRLHFTRFALHVLGITCTVQESNLQPSD